MPWFGLLILFASAAALLGYGDATGEPCVSDNGCEGDLFLLQRRAKSVEAEESPAPIFASGASSFRFWGHNVAILNEKGLESQPLMLHPPARPEQTYNLQNSARESYAQWWQDRILEPILSKLGRGFFVESGALNGERHSNTLMYERKYQWSGLLVEPDPRMLQAILGKHRHVYLFDGCLSPTGQATALKFQIDEAGLSGISDSGSHTVKAQPLHALLQSIGQHTVDFWSLDIEGSEGKVLQTTDFSQVEVGVLLIEMNKDPANNQEIRNVMEKAGFVNIGHTNYIDEVDGIKKTLDQIFINPKYFMKRSRPVPTKELLPVENQNFGMHWENENPFHGDYK